MNASSLFFVRNFGSARGNPINPENWVGINPMDPLYQVQKRGKGKGKETIGVKGGGRGRNKMCSPGIEPLTCVQEVHALTILAIGFSGFFGIQKFKCLLSPIRSDTF